MAGEIHNFISGSLPEHIEVVVFGWSNEFGHCYDCGLPAAYVVGVTQDQLDALDPRIPHTKLRCSVCAAGAAADGEIITRLFTEDT